MHPLSDAGQDMFEGHGDWRTWLEKTTLGDKSEDSDTMRKRLQEESPEEDELKMLESSRQLKAVDTEQVDSANAEIRFMEQAERFKSRTVTLHFKIEELASRYEILVKFKLIKIKEEKKVYTDKLQAAETSLNQIRNLQDEFDKLNFTPFVNTSKKEELVLKIRRQHRRLGT